MVSAIMQAPPSHVSLSNYDIDGCIAGYMYAKDLALCIMLPTCRGATPLMQFHTCPASHCSLSQMCSLPSSDAASLCYYGAVQGDLARLLMTLLYATYSVQGRKLPFQLQHCRLYACMRYAVMRSSCLSLPVLSHSAAVRLFQRLRKTCSAANGSKGCINFSCNGEATVHFRLGLVPKVPRTAAEDD